MEERVVVPHDGDSAPAGSAEAPAAPSIGVSTDMVQIDNLKIDRKVIVDYLHGIAADKRAIALVHALEVGVTELLARRERFKH